MPIAPDGTVALPDGPDGVRVGMRYLVQRTPIGGALRYTTLRAGKRMEVDVRATPRRPHLMPPRQPVPQPQWLVIGGFVFTPLLPDYELLVPKCQMQRVHEPPAFDGEQVVSPADSTPSHTVTRISRWLSRILVTWHASWAGGAAASCAAGRGEHRLRGRVRHARHV